MKKYLAILTAFVAVILSSCSNDDITITEPTTFKIDPNTVISGFEEFDPGDLTVIPSTYQLRIRLLIYNDAGQLVTETEQFFSDYAHKMTANLDLPLDKKYKAIAVTDITRKSDGFEYWEISGEESLSTLKFKDTGYIGSQRSILGLASVDFVGGNTSEVKLDVRPAGTLMIVYYSGIRSYTNVTDYQLGINRNSDYVTFDNAGKPEWNVEASSTIDWRISHIEVADWDDQPDITNIYDYVFTLPCGNTNMVFQYKTKTSNGWADLTNSINLNLREGSEYFVFCDIAEQEIGYEELATGRSSMNLSDILYENNLENCIINKLYDFKTIK